MNRRSFLGVLAGAPTALAFGQSQQTRAIPPVQPELPKIAEVIRTPVRELECTVGDFVVNANGHRYRHEVWEQMFAGFPLHGPYVMLSDDYEPHLRLDLVAGRITDWGYRLNVDLDDNRVTKKAVWVQMQVTDTPQGRVLSKAYQRLENLRKEGIMAGLNQFLTPVGHGSISKDGVIADDYVLKYFTISNNSAFECATPLQDSRNFRGLVGYRGSNWRALPGGEALKYPVSIRRYVKTV